jgi:hypothetical protein
MNLSLEYMILSEMQPELLCRGSGMTSDKDFASHHLKGSEILIQ